MINLLKKSLLLVICAQIALPPQMLPVMGTAWAELSALPSNKGTKTMPEETAPGVNAAKVADLNNMFELIGKTPEIETVSPVPAKDEVLTTEFKLKYERAQNFDKYRYYIQLQRAEELKRQYNFTTKKYNPGFNSETIRYTWIQYHLVESAVTHQKTNQKTPLADAMKDALLVIDNMREKELAQLTAIKKAREAIVLADTDQTTGATEGPFAYAPLINVKQNEDGSLTSAFYVQKSGTPNIEKYVQALHKHMLEQYINFSNLAKSDFARKYLGLDGLKISGDSAKTTLKTIDQIEHLMTSISRHPESWGVQNFDDSGFAKVTLVMKDGIYQFQWNGIILNRDDTYTEYYYPSGPIKGTRVYASGSTAGTPIENFVKFMPKPSIETVQGSDGTPVVASPAPPLADPASLIDHGADLAQQANSKPDASSLIQAIEDTEKKEAVKTAILSTLDNPARIEELFPGIDINAPVTTTGVVSIYNQLRWLDSSTLTQEDKDVAWESVIEDITALAGKGDASAMAWLSKNGFRDEANKAIANVAATDPANLVGSAEPTPTTGLSGGTLLETLLLPSILTFDAPANPDTPKTQAVLDAEKVVQEAQEALEAAQKAVENSIAASALAEFNLALALEKKEAAKKALENAQAALENEKNIPLVDKVISNILDQGIPPGVHVPFLGGKTYRVDGAIATAYVVPGSDEEKAAANKDFNSNRILIQSLAVTEGYRIGTTGLTGDEKGATAWGNQFEVLMLSIANLKNSPKIKAGDKVIVIVDSEGILVKTDKGVILLENKSPEAKTLYGSLSAVLSESNQTLAKKFINTARHYTGLGGTLMDVAKEKAAEKGVNIRDFFSLDLINKANLTTTALPATSPRELTLTGDVEIAKKLLDSAKKDHDKIEDIFISSNNSINTATKNVNDAEEKVKTANLKLNKAVELAKNHSESEKKIIELKEIADTKEIELETANKNLHQANQDLADIQLKYIDPLNKELVDILAEIARLEAEKKSLQDQIAALNRSIENPETLQTLLGEEPVGADYFSKKGPAYFTKEESDIFNEMHPTSVLGPTSDMTNTSILQGFLNPEDTNPASAMGRILTLEAAEKSRKLTPDEISIVRGNGYLKAINAVGGAYPTVPITKQNFLDAKALEEFSEAELAQLNQATGKNYGPNSNPGIVIASVKNPTTGKVTYYEAKLSRISLAALVERRHLLLKQEIDVYKSKQEITKLENKIKTTVTSQIIKNNEKYESVYSVLNKWEEAENAHRDAIEKAKTSLSALEKAVSFTKLDLLKAKAEAAAKTAKESVEEAARLLLEKTAADKNLKEVTQNAEKAAALAATKAKELDAAIAKYEAAEIAARNAQLAREAASAAVIEANRAVNEKGISLAEKKKREATKVAAQKAEKTAVETYQEKVAELETLDVPTALAAKAAEEAIKESARLLSLREEAEKKSKELAEQEADARNAAETASKEAKKAELERAEASKALEPDFTETLSQMLFEKNKDNAFYKLYLKTKNPSDLLKAIEYVERLSKSLVSAPRFVKAAQDWLQANQVRVDHIKMDIAENLAKKSINTVVPIKPVYPDELFEKNSNYKKFLSTGDLDSLSKAIEDIERLAKLSPKKYPLAVHAAEFIASYNAWDKYQAEVMAERNLRYETEMASKLFNVELWEVGHTAPDGKYEILFYTIDRDQKLESGWSIKQKDPTKDPIIGAWANPRQASSSYLEYMEDPGIRTALSLVSHYYEAYESGESKKSIWSLAIATTKNWFKKQQNTVSDIPSLYVVNIKKGSEIAAVMGRFVGNEPPAAPGTLVTKIDLMKYMKEDALGNWVVDWSKATPDNIKDLYTIRLFNQLKKSTNSGVVTVDTLVEHVSEAVIISNKTDWERWQIALADAYAARHQYDGMDVEDIRYATLSPAQYAAYVARQEAALAPKKTLPRSPANKPKSTPAPKNTPKAAPRTTPVPTPRTTPAPDPRPVPGPGPKVEPPVTSWYQPNKNPKGGPVGKQPTRPNSNPIGPCGGGTGQACA